MEPAGRMRSGPCPVRPLFLFYAACPIPALDAAFYSVYMLATYFVCRRLFAHGRALQVLCVGSLFPIGAALLLAVCSFFVFRSSVLEAGFEDTYHFRFLFRPLGYITNIWAEVLLMVSGWICLMRRWSVPLQFLCLLAILLSFSRGAYVALGIYLLFALLFFPKAEKLRLWLPAVAAMLLVAVLLPKEMHTTLQMNRTASQQQSTESRISGTAAAWQAFTERPLMGYGNGNYTYAVDAITGQDSTKPFTSIAPSLPVQLLVEKGICGTLVYLFAGIMIVRTLWQHRKKPDSRIIAATLLAVLVKDFAQATWLGTPVLLLMSYILPAYLQRDETLSAETDRTAYMVPAFAVAVWVSWNIPSSRFLTDSTLDYLQDRNYDAACACHPEDVQLQYLYALSVANEYPEKSDSILESLASRYPRNSLYLSAYARRVLSARRQCGCFTADGGSRTLHTAYGQWRTDAGMEASRLTVLQPGVEGSRRSSSCTGRGTCRLCPLRLSGIYSRRYAASWKVSATGCPCIAQSDDSMAAAG